MDYFIVQWVKQYTSNTKSFQELIHLIFVLFQTLQIRNDFFKMLIYYGNPSVFFFFLVEAGTTQTLIMKEGFIFHFFNFCQGGKGKWLGKGHEKGHKIPPHFFRPLVAVWFRFWLFGAWYTAGPDNRHNLVRIKVRICYVKCLIAHVT